MPGIIVSPQFTGIGRLPKRIKRLERLAKKLDGSVYYPLNDVGKGLVTIVIKDEVYYDLTVRRAEDLLRYLSRIRQR